MEEQYRGMGLGVGIKLHCPYKSSPISHLYPTAMACGGWLTRFQKKDSLNDNGLIIELLQGGEMG